MNYSSIPVHRIAGEIGTEICSALPDFHAYSGCDTVSAFAEGTKQPGKSGRLSQQLRRHSPDYLQCYVRYLMMYLGTSSASRASCSHLALNKQRSTCSENNSLPLVTKDSKVCLQQRKHYDSIPYVQRFKVAHVWRQSRESESTYQCPKEWGWQITDIHWEPMWST